MIKNKFICVSHFQECDTQKDWHIINETQCPLAQWLEQSSYKAQVESSNLSGATWENIKKLDRRK